MFGIEDLKRNAANEKYRLCKYVAFGSEDKWYNDSRMAKYADRLVVLNKAFRAILNNTFEHLSIIKKPKHLQNRHISCKKVAVI